MKRRLLGYSLAGLVFYLLFLITTLPAQWLGGQMARVTNGAVNLRSSTGTAWNGSGLLELRSPGGATGLTSQARWELQWRPLLRGHLGLALETRGDLTLQSEVEFGWHSLALRNIEAELSTSHLPAFYPPAMFVSPTGRLHAKAQEFVIDTGDMRGEAQVRWLEAGSKVGAFSDLGDYLLVVHGANSTAKIRLDTLRGELKLHGEGQWNSRDGQLTLQATLHTGARDAALRPLTTLLRAQRDGDPYRLTASGRLNLPAWLAAQR